MGNKEDFEQAVRDIREATTKHEKQCPVTARILHGEGTLRCVLALDHDGEHMCMYTPHNAYVRRIAERIFENVCVRDGAVAWKGTEANPLQGCDDSIQVLLELAAVVVKTEREGLLPEDYFYRSSGPPA